MEAPQEIDFNALTMAELKDMAIEKGVKFDSKIKKAELIEKLG
ncbi:hypothetical protein [Romboutsia ilealis]|nr:hypothetical protein [Romboutsia ilealis]